MNAAAIDRFIAGVKASPGTRRNILRALGSVMRHAVKARMIPTDPVRDANRPPTAERIQLRVLNAVQVDQLADEVDGRYRALIYTAAYTGLRAGELAGLRVRRVDLLHGTLKVEESVSDVNGHLTLGKPKTRESRRTVVLPSFLLPMLEEQLRDKGPDDFVFGNHLPLRHANFYGRQFRPAVKRIIESEVAVEWTDDFKDLRFHDLRHTAASMMIKLGVHAKLVSARLGHSDIAITMNTYGHLYPGQDAEVAEQLEAEYRAAQGHAQTRRDVTRLH